MLVISYVSYILFFFLFLSYSWVLLFILLLVKSSFSQNEKHFPVQRKKKRKDFQSRFSSPHFQIKKKVKKQCA